MTKAVHTSAVGVIRALMVVTVWALGKSGLQWRARPWLARAGIGVMLGILLRLLSVSQLESSHPFPVENGQHKHLLSMTNHDPELICADVTDGTMPQPDAFNRIWNTLTQANQAEGWHGLGGARVGFSADARPCSQIGSGPKIRYFVDIDGTGDLQFPNRADNFDRWFNGLTDHDEYRYWIVTLRAADLQLDPEDGGIYTYRYLVNHETGHVLGLQDGGAPCPESIMHDTFRGCSVNRDWPSVSDRMSVQAMIPSGFGSGGGGGAKAFGGTG